MKQSISPLFRFNKIKKSTGNRTGQIALIDFCQTPLPVSCTFAPRPVLRPTEVSSSCEMIRDIGAVDDNNVLKKFLPSQ